MNIKKIIAGQIETNSYIISKNNKAILIDLGGNPEEILKYINKNKLKLEYILITHAHGDHISDINYIKTNTNAKIGLNKKDLALLKSEFNLQFGNYDNFKVDLYLENNQIIDFENIKIKIIDTPGHSPGSVCFYLEEENILFSGDLLFKQGFGRYDLPLSNYTNLKESLKKILKLPKETIVYPGHGDNTKIKNEINILNFV